MGLFDIFKKHNCPTCGRRFSKIENYMHHQLLYHSDRSFYDCSSCGLKFTDMDKLKDHVRRDHSYEKDR